MRSFGLLGNWRGVRDKVAALERRQGGAV